ncbi:MAG TPA: manganese efflux pump MntP family protein [Methanoregulaceae archaeon]|nr:manganese efflux pump MntP family protein [Methanoregulaceae archaeon]HPD75558.1 manganese efflux pump MntP family protein [Methanoregulaceae archaeon]HRY75596.1 manganese efflux pump MntP family protein [Methanoregulaceae archaeon]
MDLLLTSFLIGIGLSMDCLAVAIAAGAHLKVSRLKTAAILALFFGAFQAGMTLAGFFLASGFASLISDFDHWVAALMLFAIGGKMIYEGVHDGEEEEIPDVMNLAAVTYLAVATSIDALAVGISFAFLGMPVLSPAIIIGVVAALVSCAGVFLGGRLAHVLGRRADIAGGLILILIGLRILLEHMILA